MSYLGAAPAAYPLQFTSIYTQAFNGNGVLTSFTLNRAVADLKNIEVVVNNVQQSPYDGSYTVSGLTTLLFSEAPSSGTNNIYVIYRDQPIQSITDLTAVRKSGDIMSGPLTVNANLTVTGAANLPNTFGFKNRIINGAFQIAQRSTGASATPSAGVTTYPSLDRWFIAQTGATASLFQGQTTPQTAGVYKAGYFGRNSGQTNVPANIFMGQQIESFNVYDLRGQSATISFNAFRGANAPTSLKCAVRFGTAADQSSSSGLAGGWTGYSASTASDFTVDTTVASFTKTVTVPADAREMMVLFYYTPTGTAGANEWFALENVQLEKGSTATSFDYRPYGTELALCQRYFTRLTGRTNNYQPLGLGNTYTTTQGSYCINVPVTMRAIPSLTTSGAIYFQNLGNVNISSFAGPYSQAAGIVEGDFTMASAVTSGVTSFMRFNNATAATQQFDFSAEL